jgi:hypothetical protein
VRVFVLGAPCEPWCLDALLFYNVMCILSLSGVPLCNCVVPLFGFLIYTILLIKKKKYG